MKLPVASTAGAARLRACAAALAGLALAGPVHADLPAPVLRALAAARMGADGMAAVVVEAGAANGPPRLAHQPRVPFNPASLTKLATAAAALDLLGPQFTWRTPVYLGGAVTDGRLDGPLVIQGRGDPSLTLERLWLLLRRVQQRGVRLVDGDIVLDRSAFEDGAADPAAFDGEPLKAYNVQPDALMINFKALALRLQPDAARGQALVALDPPLAGVAVPRSVPLRGSGCGDWRSALQARLDDPAQVRLAGPYGGGCGDQTWHFAYADPASYNARAIEAMWREAGGRLTGRVRDGRAPAAATPAFEAESPPLAEVVRDMNKFSNNVIAQQLFLTLGLQLRGRGQVEAARDVVAGYLRERAGCAAEEMRIDNGSGLSRHGRLSAQCLARLLQTAWSAPWMPELVASLPVAGTEATARRLRGAPARAHLKTGSLEGVVGLAGVVHAASGRRYVMVAMINHANAAAARPALDELLRWVADDVDAGAAAALPAPSAPAAPAPPVSPGAPDAPPRDAPPAAVPAPQAPATAPAASAASAV